MVITPLNIQATASSIIFLHSIDSPVKVTQNYIVHAQI